MKSQSEINQSSKDWLLDWFILVVTDGTPVVVCLGTTMSCTFLSSLSALGCLQILDTVKLHIHTCISAGAGAFGGITILEGTGCSMPVLDTVCKEETCVIMWKVKL